MQVAGAMLDAMGAGTGPWAVYTQPSSVSLPFPTSVRELTPPADRLARAGVRVSRGG